MPQSLIDSPIIVIDTKDFPEKLISCEESIKIILMLTLLNLCMCTFSYTIGYSITRLISDDSDSNDAYWWGEIKYRIDCETNKSLSAEQSLIEKGRIAFGVDCFAFMSIRQAQHAWKRLE